ncbi:MAG: S41 family peptidase [Phycisphaerales bacterium JB040]
MMRLKITLVGIALACAGAFSFASAQSVDVRSAVDELLEQRSSQPESVPLRDFDEAWRLVRDTHFDPTFNGVDWDSVRDELRPHAIDATQAEVRGIILEMLSRLGQSHFSVIPKSGGGVVPFDSGEDGDEPGFVETLEPSLPTLELKLAETEGEAGSARPGFEIRLVGDNAVVVGVRPGSDAASKGVRPGWELLAVGNDALAPIIVEQVGALGRRTGAMYVAQIVDAMLMGADGSSTRLVFRDGEGEETALEIVREPLSESPVAFGGLPPMSPNFEHRWLDPGPLGLPEGTRIGYISFDVWLQTIPRQFDGAMVEFQDADGLIIDLRGNIGGIGAISMMIGRYLVDERASLGTMRMRDQEMHFNMQPVMVSMTGEDLEPYDGPVAVLIDGGSASTSEIFAAGIRELGRARLFGSATPGMALPAMMSTLPSGDVLLHAMAGFETPGGFTMEQAGVTPDVDAPWTRESLLEGRDDALDAAAEWIVHGEQ